MEADEMTVSRNIRSEEEIRKKRDALEKLLLMTVKQETEIGRPLFVELKRGAEFLGKIRVVHLLRLIIETLDWTLGEELPGELDVKG